MFVFCFHMFTFTCFFWFLSNTFRFFCFISFVCVFTTLHVFFWFCSNTFFLRSALHVACKMGRARVCAILLELGMDPNLISGDGFSPIHLASTAEMCRLLVNAGAFLNVKSGAGKVALHYALFPEVPSEPPNIDVVTFLIDKKAEKNQGLILHFAFVVFF
jgi:hypothetical protein